MASTSKSQKKNTSKPGKLSISTSSKDYAGNLGLPEKVSQREFESTSQFFRRLDRLVAKARAEASVESRFDVDLLDKEVNKKHKSKAVKQASVSLEQDLKRVIKSQRARKKMKKANKRRRDHLM